MAKTNGGPQVRFSGSHLKDLGPDEVIRLTRIFQKSLAGDRIQLLDKDRYQINIGSSAVNIFAAEREPSGRVTAFEVVDPSLPEEILRQVQVQERG